MIPLDTTLVLPIRVPAWTWLLAAAALLAIYMLTIENGAVLAATDAHTLHEFFHDARHFVGVPCH